MILLIILVETGVNEIRITTQDTSNAVRDLGNQHKREKIERWLSPPDPSTNHNKALKQRDEGSGAWFLESDAFAKWKKGRNSFLWLCGIPGCGKTILSSAIIKNLDSVLSSQPLLYFYFDFTDTGKQTLESMLRTLIIQLYHKRVETSQHLGSLFSSCQNGHCQPTSESLRKAFFDMIHQVKEIWLVLDALDECHSRSGSSAEGVLSWIRELLNSEQRNVHLIVASRPVHDIESGIMEFAHNDDVVPIQSSDITHDIAAHVRNRVRGDDRLKRWRSRPDVQEEIEINLVGKANGM
jgi:hypothetical protein